MVRFAGRRRELLGGIWIGDGGAERCFDDVSTKDAVAIGGRKFVGGGIRNDKFFRLRARRLGESGRTWGADNNLELSDIVGRAATSRARAGGANLGYDKDMTEGDSGEELGEISPPKGESKGEMVVVGEDSVEAEAVEDILSRWGRRRREEK